MTTEHPIEHDVVFKLYVRQHHTGHMTKQKPRAMLKALKRRLGVSSGGQLHIEVAEVHSVRQTRKGAA